jgi:hypothetical protein
MMSVPYVSYLYPAGGSADDDLAFFIDFADAFLRLGDDGVDVVSHEVHALRHEAYAAFFDFVELVDGCFHLCGAVSAIQVLQFE